MRTDNSPNAFPVPNMQDHEEFNGMSLRDYFAAKALQGWLSSYGPDNRHPVDYGAEQIIASQAYSMADAMLKEREK